MRTAVGNDHRDLGDMRPLRTGDSDLSHSIKRATERIEDLKAVLQRADFLLECSQKTAAVTDQRLTITRLNIQRSEKLAKATDLLLKAGRSVLLGS